MVGAAFHFRERVSSAAAFGGEVGLFAWDRLRVSARALVPVAGVNDEVNDAADTSGASAWLWGFSVGAAANRQAGFALSPSLQYLRPQGGDYGNALGVHVPFEWLSASGFRLGFEFSLLYGFGGEYRQLVCFDGSGCPRIEPAKRPSSAGFVAGFMIGHAFSMPGQES
jgi:hypothetical protein